MSGVEGTVCAIDVGLWTRIGFQEFMIPTCQHTVRFHIDAAIRFRIDRIDTRRKIRMSGVERIMDAIDVDRDRIFGVYDPENAGIRSDPISIQAYDPVKH